ncbi:MAG: VIT domain-containing protein [Verrucomicrobia bacterium]|nr:VIT domain-containing protein [Verrucomicrobiota bacterium]
MNCFSRTRRSAWFAFVASFACLAACAQTLAPVLMVERNNHSSPLALSKVDVDVRILGFIAETRMTLTFRNDLNRPLAGDLYFPLPIGATVSGYALDINGAMVDGVVVDKDKGRQVFEKEARKGVDPGLVEWTRGNHFKTRVFPIPAHGTRTVRVSYLSEIGTDARGNQYQLPLNFKDKLRDFHLRLEVVKAEAKPVVHRGAPVELQFGKWRDSFVAETRQTNASLAGELAVELPQIERQRLLVEKASDGHYYFCINEFPADPRPAQKQPALPALSQVTLFWDASGSRGGTDHARELAWLKTWFATYYRYKLTANLVPFRNSLAPAQRFVITNGDASSLLSAIAQLPYDGGTQIGCLTNFPAPAPGGCYFLFSDGIGNFGQPEPPALEAPLYIFTADQIVDQPFLEYLAQRGGGALFPLQRMTDQQVLVAMATRPFSFSGAESTPPNGVDLYPQITRPLRGRFTLAGKLTGPEARIVLNYGASGKKLASSKLTVSPADAVPGDLLRRFWAQKKLEDLLVMQKQNETEIADLGKQYGLVTPFTSLIVLETLDQYVEHKILPPRSLPAMRDKYARIMEERSTTAKKEEHEKIGHLLALWDKRVEWWNKTFNYSENFRLREQDQAGVGGLVNSPAAVTPLPGARAVIPMAVAPSTVASGGMPVPSASPSPDFGSARGGHAFAENRVTKSLPETATREPEPGIALKEWDPKTPYLQALKKAPPQDAFATYLAQRKKYNSSPAFYLDCAEFFRKQKQNELGIQVLSNIAELELENAALLRVLAYRLLQIGRFDLACGLFEQVLKLRPEEPQSFRDLALALASRGQTQKNPADCRRAMELLAKVVRNQWDRFDEIEVIALMELNGLWTDYGRRFPNDRFVFPADERLKKLLDLDLRIVLTWDADMTDVDLHVTEPSGEVAFYSHNLTTIGGLVSRDFTQGYGPEEYCLRKAMHGSYKIEASYYGSQAVQLMGPVTVQAEVITHFGRPNEKRRSLTLRLEEKKETALVGEVEF